MKKSVKNIIFDLGGVLLNIDYQAPVREFRRLGIEDFDQFYSKVGQLRLFDDLEVGLIQPEIFRNAIREYSKLDLSDQEIDRAWNSILLDFPIHRKEMLYRLKQSYRLFLLSNTNAIHIPCFEKNLVREHGVNFLPEVFERIYYSSRIGLRKPETTIYDFVLMDNALSAHETIFIDDSPQHVEGAKSAGITAYWLDTKSTDVTELLQSIGI